MKTGQVISTIEFPGLGEDQSAHLQARLSSLRDNVPSVDSNQMRVVLRREWGDRCEQVLASIESEPGADASIGQSYRGAKLRSSRACASKTLPQSPMGRAGSGTCPAPPASGMARCCFCTCARRLGGWRPNEPRRLAPEDLWRSTELLRDPDRRDDAAQLRRMNLPPEALLLRRTEGLLFQTAAMLRASAPWRSLMRGLTEGGEPVGELGTNTPTGSRRQRS